MAVAVLAIGAGGIAAYKKNSAMTKLSAENTVEEKRAYDLNSPPLTDMDISAVVKSASAESSVDVDEDKDSALVTSDNEALNNFNNTYVSTDF